MKYVHPSNKVTEILHSEVGKLCWVK